MEKCDTGIHLLSADFLKICRERKILAGFSGGTDSTAMVLLMQEAGADMTAVHFEHGLRGQESIGDALWAERFARAHGIPFLRVDLTVRSAGSVEKNAREARLAAWQSLTAPGGEFPGAAVALAHHSGDAVETMLERLARGGNVSSLAALRPRRVIRGVEFFRPLLGASKRMLEEYLVSKGVTECRFDSSNRNGDYFRNHIRNNLLPVWSSGYDFVQGGLEAALRALARDSEFLEAEAAERWEKRPDREEGINKISAQWFRELPGAMRFRILGIFLRLNGVPEDNAASVLERLEDSPGGTVPVDAHTELRMVRGAWKVRRKEEPVLLWQWSSLPQIEFDGDIYRVRRAAAPDLNGEDVAEEDLPGCDRVWFPLEILPETLELSRERNGRVIRRTQDAAPEPVKRFKAPDGIMSIPGSPEVLWLAGVRRSGIHPVTAGIECAVFERFPRK